MTVETGKSSNVKNLIRNTFMTQHQKQHVEDPAPALLIVSDTLSTQSNTAPGPPLHPQELPQYGHQETSTRKKLNPFPLFEY